MNRRAEMYDKMRSWYIQDGGVYIKDHEFIEEFGELGKYGLQIFWAAGNFVFVVYDVAISRVIGAYYTTLRPKIARFFK